MEPGCGFVDNVLSRSGMMHCVNIIKLERSKRKSKKLEIDKESFLICLLYRSYNLGTLKHNLRTDLVSRLIGK